MTKLERTDPRVGDISVNYGGDGYSSVSYYVILDQASSGNFTFLVWNPKDAQDPMRVWEDQPFGDDYDEDEDILLGNLYES